MKVVKISKREAPDYDVEELLADACEYRKLAKKVLDWRSRSNLLRTAEELEETAKAVSYPN